MEVGGIFITPFHSLEQAVSHALPGAREVRPGSWVAINAEKVVMARRNPIVMATVRDATVRYPDGMAVVWTLRQKGASCNRIPGVELWEALIRRAGRQRIPVYLIGARPEVLATVVARVRSEWRVQVAGATAGFDFDEDALIEEVHTSDARIVTVALGTPRQEHFIRRCREVCPDALFMGVGGTYDVVAGITPRAPTWMGAAGLEWLYRLIRQPSRLSRQLALIQYMADHVLRRL